jgi:hypothetical protein
MARDDEGKHLAERLRKLARGHLGACRRVVTAAASLTSDVGLKIRRELADTVQAAGDPGRLRPSEWLRKTGSPPTNGHHPRWAMVR